MKNIIKFLMLLFFTAFIFFMLSNNSFASSDFSLKNLDFDVKLNSNGSMNVTETWNVDVHDTTNTLFKTFNIDNTKYKEITDVKVSQIVNNEDIVFTEKNVEVLHVDKNCYYDLINKDGKFEIAWGINEDYGKKTYKIEYKVVDAIKNYNDCSELYWQFIGKNFEIDIDKVTGRIEIPEGAEKEDVRVWAHGPLNGNIKIKSPTEVEFEIEYLDNGNFLEVRMAMPTSLFAINTNIVNNERFTTILNEETAWANEANLLRERQRQRIENEKRMYEIAKAFFTVLFAALSLFLATKISKYYKALCDNPKKLPTQEFEYFRDIPDEKMTPAQAAFLYYFDEKKYKDILPKVLSATMLNLCMKNYIEFETRVKKMGKDEIVVHLKNGNKDLTEDEKIIYELLTKINSKDEKENSFTMKDLEKYAKKHFESFLNKLDKIEDTVKKEQQNQQNYDEKIHKEGNKWSNKKAYYLLAIFASIIVCIMFNVPLAILGIFIIINIVCMVLLNEISKRFSRINSTRNWWKGKMERTK